MMVQPTTSDASASQVTSDTADHRLPNGFGTDLPTDAAQPNALNAQAIPVGWTECNQCRSDYSADGAKMYMLSCADEVS